MDANDEITALRALAEALGESRAAFQSCTPKQVGVIARAFEEVIGPDREERIAVLRAIFPYGLHGYVNSTNDLSKAQASVLIGWLYGLGDDDKLTADTTVSWRAGETLSSIVGGLRRDKVIASGQAEMAP